MRWRAGSIAGIGITKQNSRADAQEFCEWVIKKIFFQIYCMFLNPRIIIFYYYKYIRGAFHLVSSVCYRY